MAVKRITFKGKKFLLVNAPENNNAPLEGAIATPFQYENFETSFAHMYPDGRVVQFGQQIGTRDDVVVVGDYVD